MTSILNICLTVLALVIYTNGDTDACMKDSPCSCKFQDGSILSLKSLGRPDGIAAFIANDSATGFTFFYNPCLTFSEGNCDGTSVAICQNLPNPSAQQTFLCGVQSSARFVYRDGDRNSDIFLLYDGDVGRKSYIKLTCTNDTKSQLTYVNENPLKTYNFELVSPCACPGNKACQKEPEVTCRKLDECSCSPSDGSGNINLNALNTPSKPLEYKQGEFHYYYNPCKGFSLSEKSSKSKCINVSVCETVDSGSSLRNMFNLGDPQTATFGRDNDGTTTLNYAGSDGRSVIRLICDKAARETPVFQFVGELTKGTFTFDLRSVCACPGECVSPPRRCIPKDSCSCSYEDGSGTINLHSLDNPYAPLKTMYDVSKGFEYKYFYNPCSGVRLDNTCFNVSACQQVKMDTMVSLEFSLGRVHPHGFSTDDDGNLVISYNGGDVDIKGMDRQFKVTFVCDHDAVAPIFGNATEAPSANYNFVLRSVCACPNACGN